MFIKIDTDGLTQTPCGPSGTSSFLALRAPRVLYAVYLSLAASLAHISAVSLVRLTIPPSLLLHCLPPYLLFLHLSFVLLLLLSSFILLFSFHASHFCSLFIRGPPFSSQGNRVFKAGMWVLWMWVLAMCFNTTPGLFVGVVG